MITLELTVEEVNIILTGLGELAAKLSMPVIQKIQEQAQPQIVSESIPQPTEEQACGQKVLQQILFFYDGKY